jgi:uncharacterized protein (DUF1778 family)
VTDFIRQKAITDPGQDVGQSEVWILESLDAEVFAAALMKPAKLGSQLPQAAKRYKEQFLQH